MRNRLDTTVNIMILLTLAIMLFNPRGVVGSRILEWRAERDMRSQIALVWNDLVAAGSSFGASSTYSHQIIEFVDYQCTSCRAIADQVNTAARDGGVRVIVRHLPLAAHEHANSAARIAVCAEEQGVFEEVHHALLAHSDWGKDTSDLYALAQEMQLPDLRRFDDCLSSERPDERILNDRRLAEALGIRGTPTFVTPIQVLAGADKVFDAIQTVRVNK